jgi:hypothetical protein
VPRGSTLGEGFAYRTFAFAPSDANTVYAGTGAFTSAGQFDGSLAGKGVYVSHDGGTTWSPANDANSAAAQAASIAVHPTNPQIAYAAALGAGLLRTTNGGTSWSKLQGTWPATSPVRAVTVSNVDPQIVLVGTASGLFRTPDGGATWQQLTSGFAPESIVTSVVVDPTNPQIMYLSDLTGGVYRTENGGGLWAPINQGLRTKAVNRLALSSDGAHLYAATEGEGVFRLDLNGSPPPAANDQQFSDVPPTHPYYEAISDLAGRTIINGYPDATFKPENPVIRQQFAKMIVRSMGYQVTLDDFCPFSDVPSNVSETDPLYPDRYVAVCANHGITVGYPGDVFKPALSISRQQLITMVTRAADLPEPPDGFEPGFTRGQFSADHYGNARKASHAGLLDGLLGVGESYDFFAPASRGECSQLLHNLLGRLLVSGLRR